MAKLKSRAWHSHDRARRIPQLVGLLPVLLSSLGVGAAQAEPLVDSTGRSVEIAAPVAIVLPAGAPAQVLLQAVAPERLGALVETFGADDVPYVDARLLKLPKIAMLSRNPGQDTVAAASALKPDLVVDYGSLSSRYIAADEKIGRALNVPAVLFSGDLADVPAVVRVLAKPLGAGERGEAVAKQAEAVLARLKPFAALVEADRVSIYVARGGDGLDALRAGTSFDEPLRMAGARNVVTGGGGPFKRMSIDDVVALKPDVVVIGELGVLSSLLHAALPKTTKWVLDAGVPYRVLTGPPSINRLVGAVALAALLHPSDSFDADTIGRIETTLFPVPPGVSVPAPLQLRQ